MSVPRFDIVLDSNRTYQPGQDVTGHVIVDLTGKTNTISTSNLLFLFHRLLLFLFSTWCGFNNKLC